jgi:hypothetical protein
MLDLLALASYVLDRVSRLSGSSDAPSAFSEDLVNDIKLAHLTVSHFYGRFSEKYEYVSPSVGGLYTRLIVSSPSVC